MGNKSGRMRNIFSKYILDTPIWYRVNPYQQVKILNMLLMNIVDVKSLFTYA